MSFAGRRNKYPSLTVDIARRRACTLVAASLAGLCLPETVSAAVQLSAARLWPAREYTRLTLESTEPLTCQVLTLRDPIRVAVDIEGIDASPELAALASRLSADDPTIASIRTGRHRPGVLRLVLELKTEVTPQTFALKPVGDYGHRVVVDLYPSTPLDPLMALVEAEERNARQSPPRDDDRARRNERRRPITIALDPGHGGEDPGAIGRAGTYEKHVALAIGRRLKSMFDGDTGIRAMLTRDDDYFVPLGARVARARRVQADLFVSIHADAFEKPHARGASVFALSENGATSAAARWLAQRENEADLIGGVNIDVKDPVLARTLLDLSQTATINDSLKIGRFVLDEIAGVNVLHKPRVEQAGFAVLKAPDIPSILIETAFISNPEEEKKLRNERYQTRMAESIREGIRRYFARNPPLART